MELIFEMAGELIIIKIDKTNVLFSNSTLGYNNMLPIEFLKLDINGILKEFPDLRGKEEGEIRKEANRRFKEYIKSLDGEERIKDYIIKELEKAGYTLKNIKREGFRDEYIR